MPREVFKNNSATTLASGIDDTQTSFDVDAGGVFPSSGQFRIIIDDEIMLCTSRSSDTLTVVRGVESSTPASHSGSAPCTHIVTAAALTQHVRDNVSLFGDAVQPLLNSLTNKAGDKLVLSDFAWINQGGATAANYASGGISFVCPTETSLNARILKKAAPANPYSVIAAFRYCLPGGTGDFPQFGLFFRLASSSQLYRLVVVGQNTATRVYVLKMNNQTSAHSTLLNGIQCEFGGSEVWLRIQDDGTNLKFYVGLDGNTWLQVASEGRAAFMSGGPDEVGFGMVNDGNDVASIACSLLHWGEV